MSVKTGLQLPFGIQPVNPVPVDSWSGPFESLTLAGAVSDANASIPESIRYQSMEVRIIVGGTSYKYWYKNGVSDSDLVPFSSGEAQPAGSNGQVQFNLSGSFGASSGLSYDPVSQSLTAINLRGSLTQLSDGSPYLIGGSNVSIATNPNGSITISSIGAGVSALMQWNDSVSGEVDGLNSVFSLSYSPSPVSSLMFYVNGVLQKSSLDYVLSGNIVTTTVAPEPGSSVTATYAYVIAPPAGSSISWTEVPSGTVDGINQEYVLSNVPHPLSALMFHVNGVLQRSGIDYVISGSVVTLSYAPEPDSTILATYPY
jgi:hypothetical protein